MVIRTMNDIPKKNGYYDIRDDISINTENYSYTKWIYGIIIILFFSILIYICIVRQTTYMVKQLLDGFYVADSIFCEESNLDMLCLYLDNGDGYIFIKGNSGDIILNTPIKYKLIRQTHITAQLNSGYIYTIIFEGLTDNNSELEFFPKKQILEFIPTTQRIKLYDDATDTIYGILYKNNSATDMKELLINTPLQNDAADYTDADAANDIAADYTDAANDIMADYTDAANDIAVDYTDAANDITADYTDDDAANDIAADYTDATAENDKSI
jgi:hypothetical protein